MNKAVYRISPDQAGKRLDQSAAELSGLTRSNIQKLIEGGLLLLNGCTSKSNCRTYDQDVISISFPDKDAGLFPEGISIDILYKDDSLIVVNKPAGMVVYPAAGHDRGTLMNAVAFHADKLASVGGPLRPGVVHRLDKDTSGVMVVALSDNSYYDLVEQFRSRTINRVYKSLVFGTMKDELGDILLRIGRSSSDRKKMSTKTQRGKEARTSWKVIERFRQATLIEAKLGTGRTHQIRVHFASIGHPVLGDRTYGMKTYLEFGKSRISFPRQMLHAGLLGFVHPETKEYIEFRSPLPPDMEGKLEELRQLS